MTRSEESHERHRKYQRERRARNRTDYLRDKACVRCGSREDLELHHRDPDAKVTNVVWSWSRARREEELAKCDVLCNRCHLAAHGRKPDSGGHGTASYYTNKGCRCEACKAANAAAQRDYQARRRGLALN